MILKILMFLKNVILKENFLKKEVIFILIYLFYNNHINLPGQEAAVGSLQQLDWGSWRLRRAWPGGRGSTAGARAVGLGHYLYVVGGESRLCERYSPSTDTWVQLTQPVGCHSLGAVVVWGNTLLLLGGDERRDGVWVIGDEVEQYNIQDDTWSVCDWKLPVKVGHYPGVFVVDLPQ